MCFLKNILNEVLTLTKMIFSNILSEDRNILSEDELNEAIRLSKVSLSDHFILNRPKLLASTNYTLAINYYRKAFLYSSFSNDDVTQCIFYAQQAESFYSKEESPSRWRQLQKILGLMFTVRGDGVRAEHFETSTDYLENWLHSTADREEKANAYIALMRSYAFRLKGNKEENFRKAKEYYEKAIECYPKDENWISFVNQQKAIVDITYNRPLFDHPTGNEFNDLPKIIQMLSKDQHWTQADRFEPIQLFILLNRLKEIIDTSIEVLEENLTESQMDEIQYLCVNMNFFGLMRILSSTAPEKSDLILNEINEFIQENIEFSEKLGEATEINEKAEVELFISLLYMMKAGLYRKDDDIEAAFEQAEFYFEKSWSYKTSFQKRPFLLFWQGKSIGTLLYFTRRKWSKAAKLYEETLEALETNYKSAMGSPGKDVLLSLLSAHDTPLSLNYVFVLAKIGEFQKAVVTLENWRGRELNERLNRNNFMLGKVNESDRNAYQKIWNEISSIEIEMNNKGDENYLALSKILHNKREELKNLISHIRTYLPEFLSEPTFSTIQKTAEPKKPLVYLLTTAQGSLILIVKSDGEVKSLFVENFTNAEAGILAENLQSALKNIKNNKNKIKALNDFAESLEKLGKYFVQALIDELHKLQAASVCLISCGVLSQIPWHAAPTPEGKILLDCFDVSYSPTAKLLSDAQKKLKIKKEKMNGKSGSFKGVADPTGNLEYAAKEVSDISELWKTVQTNTVLMISEPSTKEEIKNSVSADVWHFACHGTFNASDPLDSALILSGNEKLTLREILEQDDYQHFAESRLVVLSACQTALVDVDEKPEENIGLPLGFMSKGVPGTIGTLWSVDDKISALLMSRFYEIWLETKNSSDFSPSIALMKAQNWLRQASKEDVDMFDYRLSDKGRDFSSREAYLKTENRTEISDLFKNPYFWAGFIFIGV